MLMELIHFSGVRPLPSFSSPRPPTTTTTGPGRQSVAAAPPLAEVPQDRDLNLPLLHRVLKAPSAALPTPPTHFHQVKDLPLQLFCFTLSSFSPNAFSQEFSCSPASRTSGTSAESMLNDLLKRVRKKKSVKKKKKTPPSQSTKEEPRQQFAKKQTGPQLHLTCLGGVV